MPVRNLGALPPGSLKRHAPDHFSFRHQNRDPLKYLGRRRLKQLLAEAAQQVSPKGKQVPAKSSRGKRSQRSHNESIEKIKAQVKDLLGDMDSDERFNLLSDLDY
jgi:hypothetical protein